MRPIQHQIFLLLSLILSSRAFTTHLDRTSTASIRAQRNSRQLRQYSTRTECLLIQSKRAFHVVETSHLQPFPLSAASGDEVSSSGDEDFEKVAAETTNTGIGPKWKRILFFYKYNKDGTLKPYEDDGLNFKQKLAKAGLSVLLSYGFVSNMSYCVTVSLAWFGFSKKTGLSPLAPGQWKGFLAVYAGFYVFNNFIRPMRFAASVGVAPYFERAVKTVQRKTKLSKGLSIGIVVFLANICGTTSLMSLGIYIASLAAGIPVFPPKA